MQLYTLGGIGLIHTFLEGARVGVAVGSIPSKVRTVPVQSTCRCAREHRQEPLTVCGPDNLLDSLRPVEERTNSDDFSLNIYYR